MLNLILVLLGFGPSLVWLYWLWSRDRFQREPVGMVLKLMFLGGTVSVGLTLLTVPVMTAQLPGLQESVVMEMLLSAALPEEVFKMLPVLAVAWRSPQWSEPFDGIVYAGASALGFHLVETVIYMLRGLESGVGDAVFQGLIRGAKPGHMLYGVAMGFFLSHARFARSLSGRVQNLALAVLVPVGLHEAWDVAAAYGGSFVGGSSLAELLSSLTAWGLSVALWTTAFEYMRRDEAASPFGPGADLTVAASVPCVHCGSGYPERARFCAACGHTVHGAAPTAQQL